jgi:hypothetical protein
MVLVTISENIPEVLTFPRSIRVFYCAHTDLGASSIAGLALCHLGDLSIIHIEF